MNPVRIGRVVRTLRRRLGWRQLDLATRARVSQQTISLIETGQLRRLSLATLERVLFCLEAELDLTVRWRGGELDRLLDEGHAAVVGAVTGKLERQGWLVRVETTYAVGRERGSIDLLGFKPEAAALLVGEIKTDITSAESTLRKHDEKVRLAAGIARQRFGWEVRSVSRVLVVPDGTTSRRRIERHDALMRHAYPVRGRELSSWLRAPTGGIGGLLFLPPTTIVGGRRDLTSRRRIRPPVASPAEHVPHVLTGSERPLGRRKAS